MTLLSFRRACSLALGLGTAALLSSTATSLAGCAPTFDPFSEVKTLRVFGARASEPYAKPGEKVSIDLLYSDASPKAIRPDGSRRPVNVLWLGGCNNPDGDQYFACFPQFAQTFASLAGSDGQPDFTKLPPGSVGFGDSFTVTLPDDIISSRPPPSGSTVPYGLAYAFFFACAGDLVPDGKGANGLPISCLDPETKQPLGADDFVFGYMSVYAYDELTNKNPVIDGRTFQDQPLDEALCTDETVCAEGFRCGFAAPRTCIPVVPHCTAEKLADCPTYKFGPVLDQAKNAEVDPNAKNPDGSALQEVIWVYYYASDGTITKDTRLINDAQAGWQDATKFGTEWKAPGEASGPTRVWGVFHDNRGGANWTWWDLYVD
jgi:hypothetical protein